MDGWSRGARAEMMAAMNGGGDGSLVVHWQGGRERKGRRKERKETKKEREREWVFDFWKL